MLVSGHRALGDKKPKAARRVKILASLMLLDPDKLGFSRAKRCGPGDGAIIVCGVSTEPGGIELW